MERYHNADTFRLRMVVKQQDNKLETLDDKKQNSTLDNRYNLDDFFADFG
jgi:hypothetical protein